MKKILLLFLLIIFQIINAENVFGQRSIPLNGWISAGVGYGFNYEKTLQDAAGTVSASLTYKQFIITARAGISASERMQCGHFNTIDCKDSWYQNYLERSYRYDYAVIPGVVFVGKHTIFSIGTGVGIITFVEAQKKGEDFQRQSNNIGVAIDAKTIMKLNNYFGVGIELYYNANERRNFGGLIFSFQCGYFG